MGAVAAARPVAKTESPACPTTIARLLRDQKLGLRSHRKVLHTGKHHAERNKQFCRIASPREAFRKTRDPRISVETKNKKRVAFTAIQTAAAGIRRRDGP